LLQQTPADKMLGDVLLNFSGTVFLYEFKRSLGDDKKEYRKAEKLRVVLAANPELLPVSRAVHWYVVSLPAVENAESKIVLSRYIDVGTSTSGDLQLLSRYVNTLAESALNSRLNSIDPELTKRYIETVASISDVESISTGGMLVAINSTGAVQYTVLRDLRELGLRHDKHIELESDRQTALQKQFDQQREVLASERSISSPRMGR
jgi:hypothetical protein